MSLPRLEDREASAGNVARLWALGSVAVFAATIGVWILSMVLSRGYRWLTVGWLMLQELRGVRRARAPVVLLDPSGKPIVSADVDLSIENREPEPAPVVDPTNADEPTRPAPAVDVDGIGAKTL